MEKNKKGFSLLELLLVMGIIAGLIVGAFIVYPKVQSYRNVKIEVSNISTLKAETTALYASTSGNIPDALSLNPILTKSKSVPDSMKYSSTKLRNVWGGDVYVGTYDIAASASFAIQYNHVPKDDCAKLVMQTATGFEQVVVGSEMAGDTGGIIREGSSRGVVFGINRYGDGEVELNVANVVEACNKSENSFILYKFF